MHAIGTTPGEIEVSSAGAGAISGKIAVVWEIGIADAAQALLLISDAFQSKSELLERQLVSLSIELKSAPWSRPRFDESLDLFERIVGGPRQQQAAHLEIRAETDSVIGSFTQALTPGDVTTLALRSPDSGHLTVGAQDLGLLQRAAKILGFVDARMELSVIERHSAPKRVKFGDYRFVFRSRNGDEVSHSLLSYGQKRLFAFLYYCHLDLPAPIVADELVNGMHHEWIEACL